MLAWVLGCTVGRLDLLGVCTGFADGADVKGRLKRAHFRLGIFLLDPRKYLPAFFSTARGGRAVARRPARTVPRTGSLPPATPTPCAP